MAGGALVPMDDLADKEQFAAALASSAARLTFTTARHLEISGDIVRAHAARGILVDEPVGDGPSTTAEKLCSPSRSRI